VQATIFIHISDPHIVPKGTDLYGTDSASNLRAVADRIRAMDLAPEFFVFSGDLTDRGDPASYAHLSEILERSFAPFGVPVLLGLGNHDSRAAFRRVILGADSGDDPTPYFYARCFDECRVLMLDSVVPGRADGLLGKHQLDWLAQQLATPASGGDLLVLHHPCVPRGVPRQSEYLLRDAPALAEVLTSLRHRVIGILCGHSHVSTATLFAGVLHVTTSATAYLLDPTRRDAGHALEGAGFSVCTVRDGRLFVNPAVLPGTQRHLAQITGRPTASV
jgi:3',5'-cyclic AMP phosphodiesterase CpdA